MASSDALWLFTLLSVIALCHHAYSQGEVIQKSAAAPSSDADLW